MKVLLGLSSLSRDSSGGAVRILEDEMGHYASVMAKQCIDSAGNPLPWFTYPAIEYLKQLDLKDKKMLEWGSGNSSIFFSRRVKQLVSIEHDKTWYNAVNKKRLKNHDIILKSEDEYTELDLYLSTKFDIILVDGIKREDCVETAIKLIASDGLIILDNSDRHYDLCSRLRDEDFIEVDMHGFGPINEYTWTTSLFFRRSFKISPIDRQPKIPVGGGY